MKAVLHYIVLVGLPVLSVLVLLRIGEQSLKAPASIHGNWGLALEPQAVRVVCPGLVFPAEDSILNINQSGPQLYLMFNDKNGTTLRGELTDLTISAEATDPAEPRKVLWTFAAAVNREAAPDRLEGILSGDSCSSALSVTAHRLPELNQTTGGH